MKRLCYNFYLIGCLLLLIGCKKDNYHYPDVVTDLVDADTNTSQQFYRIRTDAGEELTLTEPVQFDKCTPDSTYRIRCRYQRQEGQNAKLYAATVILAPEPQSASYFKDSIFHDPVKITSVWKSGSYLNLHLGVMTKLEEKHALNFVKQERTETPDGKYAYHIQLYHNQNKDPEAFTREAFLSCSLKSLNLQQGDSIYLRIMTYQGWEQIGFKK